MISDALYDPILVGAVEALKSFHWGRQSTTITLVRDALGHISATISDDKTISDEQWEELQLHVDDALRASGGTGKRLWRESELLIPEEIVQSIDRVAIPSLSTSSVEIFLVDRLLNNQDWLRIPLPKPANTPKLAVAYSVKGGVGRTTAFAVLGWWLARKGHKVAMLDLDLESPGAGSVLLDEGSQPDYGIVDWLYATLTGTPPPQLDDSYGSAPIAQDSDGWIRVFPAYGRQSCEYISKLGRVYMPTLTKTRDREGFAERLLMYVTAINTNFTPDVILIDSRAGLDDIGASVVTRLGAEVFLFSRNDPQSWDGYRQLFTHLCHSQAITYGMPDGDLRWRLKMTLAQADSAEDIRQAAIRTSFEAWGGLYDEVLPKQDDVIEMQIPPSELDESAPHFPLFVPFNSETRAWRLNSFEGRPSFDIVQQTYAVFCEAAAARLGIEK